jgi:LPXTG-site transpeptidase (sortase) family protein
VEPLSRILRAPVLLAGALLILAGCGGADSVAGTTPGRAAATAGSSGTTADGTVGEVPPASVGTPAASQRIRFVPTAIELPGAVRAPVDPASTVGGLLVVPENAQRVGWWDGGAQAGDPFGALVIAGHVDSASMGTGFFGRLLKVRVGDRVSVSDPAHQGAYKVISLRSVPKNALATGTFDQTGAHRLVLITCTGRYDRARGGYESNLVVTAVPLGPAH